jgi:hypothetical protein
MYAAESSQVAAIGPSAGSGVKVNRAASPQILGGVILVLVLLPNLGGSCPTFRDHRIEFAMVQPSSSPHGFLSHEPCADSDHPALLFPNRFVRYVPTDLLAQSAGRQPIRPRARQGLTFTGEASPWSLGSPARVGSAHRRAGEKSRHRQNHLSRAGHLCRRALIALELQATRGGGDGRCTAAA